MVCLYTRISTDEENRPTSLHSQRERLDRPARRRRGGEVAHEQDQATGAKLDRPGLPATLDHARSGAIDLLLVYRLDRLSRKVRHLARLAEELEALGVVLRSVTEPFDAGSAAGGMMLQMLAVFAEFEHAAAAASAARTPRSAAATPATTCSPGCCAAAAAGAPTPA